MTLNELLNTEAFELNKEAIISTIKNDDCADYLECEAEVVPRFKNDDEAIILINAGEMTFIDERGEWYSPDNASQEYINHLLDWKPELEFSCWSLERN